MPVIAVDIAQKPCQTSFTGVDNKYGGFVAGVLAGQQVKANWNCKYDAWISLEEPEIGAANETAWVATARASSRSAQARSPT